MTRSAPAQTPLAGRRPARRAAPAVLLALGLLFAACPAGGPGPGEEGAAAGAPGTMTRAPRTSIEDMTSQAYSETCLTAGCHAQLAQTRWVHAPAAVGSCDRCHAPAGTLHAFLPPPTTGTACLDCHDPEHGLSSVHDPYANLACLDCHDPHGGLSRSFLRFDSVGDLCTSCHADPTPPSSHRPVEEGDCTACHDAHGSTRAALLTRDADELCAGCHGDYRELLPEELGRGGTLAHLHGAILEGGCSSCHDAHGSAHVPLLAEPVRETCLGCHPETAAGLTEAHSAHGAFLEEDSCTDCHSPHSSSHDGLLLDRGYALCLTCHDRELPTPDGRVVRDMHRVLAEARVLHAPAAHGECTACHRAHFSDGRALLTPGYPLGIYARAGTDTYELCFECHERALAERPSFAGTGFRDGDRNLHALHVGGEKGRACDICHDPHGTAGPALVREAFPFGPSRWPMPIHFERTPTGGACASACHELEAYDRETPVRR